MQPLFFGRSSQQLFGMYHAPASGPGRARAAVLCHPLGHEYLRAHRAFRNLAAALADAGWHVLRFDYLGSGDSSGSDEQTTVEQCRADLDAAIQEIKDIADVRKVTLVGLRLGATFAALAAAERRDVDRVILWDPVSSGADYMEHVAALQRRWLEDRLGPSAASLAESDELIGFRVTPTTRGQLAALSIVPAPRLRAGCVSIFGSEALPLYETVRAAVEEAGAAASCTIVPESCEWDRGDSVHQILLPHAMIRAIVTAMKG